MRQSGAPMLSQRQQCRCLCCHTLRLCCRRRASNVPQPIELSAFVSKQRDGSPADSEEDGENGAEHRARAPHAPEQCVVVYRHGYETHKCQRTNNGCTATYAERHKRACQRRCKAAETARNVQRQQRMRGATERARQIHGMLQYAYEMVNEDAANSPQRSRVNERQ